MKFEYGLWSDIGQRKASNQDKVLIKIGEIETVGEFGLFAVADGMGGMAEGEKASQVAIETLKNWWDALKVEQIFNRDLNLMCGELHKQFQLINSSLRDYGDAKNIKIGTTLSATFVINGYYAVCHIGDSRVYKLNSRKGSLKLLTKDHSYVAEQVRAGLMSAEEAVNHPKKNVLTQCLGIQEEICPFMATGKTGDGDVFVLCSDGLYSKVPERDLVNVIVDGIKKNVNLKEIGEKLVEIANNNGGNDNISSVIFWDKEGHKSNFSVLQKLKAIFY